ncbi:hypothetical protein MKEN_01269700 [Mycena kentingensis (nom. inval.)]|nr:hypothetical protein MKEN_01269700 [Mycena kentingensis (nom. inval.)]
MVRVRCRRQSTRSRARGKKKRFDRCGCPSQQPCQRDPAECTPSRCTVHNMGLLTPALLAVLSCINNTIVQYATVGVLLLHATYLLARPLGPHALMDDLEHQLDEAKYLFDDARERNTLRNRKARLNIHLDLTSALATSSFLRCEVLRAHGAHPTIEDYLHIFSSLCFNIRKSRKAVQGVKLAIMKAAALERHEFCRDDAEDIRVVAASGSYT